MQDYPDSVAAILVDNAAPTPPLADFLTAYYEDDNLWWRIGCGHHQNLFEVAVQVIEGLAQQQLGERQQDQRDDDRDQHHQGEPPVRTV
jgi:hypothetical protein